MPSIEDTLAAIGNEPPLVTGGRTKPPDRRELSTRWLCGTFLTGITSSVLMGVALSVALDGREQLATPPQLLRPTPSKAAMDQPETDKTDRLVTTRMLARLSAGRRVDVTTKTKTGDREVVRTLPFVQVRMSVGAGHTSDRSYPPFNPLEVLAEDVPAQRQVSRDTIYGAKVDSAISLRTIEFPLEPTVFEEISALSSEDVEAVVRGAGRVLVDGEVEVAALHHVDPERFGGGGASLPDPVPGIRIVQENVSVVSSRNEVGGSIDYAEDIVPIRSDTTISEVLAEAGYEEAGADDIGAAAIPSDASNLRPGDVLRVGIETRNNVVQIVRASVYRERKHIVSVALGDNGRYVRGSEPEANPAVLTAFETTHQLVGQASGEVSTVYDGIYRATFSHGLTQPMTRQLMQLLANKVDFESPADLEDQIEVFFSQPDDDDNATNESELLYVQTSLGGVARTFYRFQMDDGSIDYFDGMGRSARQFLLRNPIPNGQFTSGFGNRRHPILGYARAHTGVDWAAPRGTPILASGDGIVEQAGWNGGYGRQTIIRHANGYQTTFNHQNKIADGVVPGARIRQGQIIGYVGSTGLSTGNHLHYELIINGKKVDPMRVRLPAERILEGDELEAFLTERRRIDELLLQERDAAGDPQTPARNI